MLPKQTISPSVNLAANRGGNQPVLAAASDSTPPASTSPLPPSPQSVPAPPPPSPEPSRRRGTLWLLTGLILLFGGLALIGPNQLSRYLSFFNPQQALEDYLTELGLLTSTGELNTDQFQGDKGEKGDQGDRGTQGETGDTGPRGFTGLPGPTGEQGPQGLQGENGCISGECISLQSTTPGTQETGHLNISGSGIFGSLQSTDLTVDTDTLYVDSTNNRVGIGTVSPQRALHVFGSGVQRILVESSDNQGSIGFISNGTGEFNIYSPHKTDDLRFWDGTNDVMSLLSGGNVGIGDISPAALLTVGSGDLFQVASDGNLQSSNAGTWTFTNDTNFVLSGGTNGLSFDGTTLSIDATNDRVGIGTVSPGLALHVKSGSSSGGIRVEDNSTSTDILVDIGEINADDGAIYLYNNNVISGRLTASDFTNSKLGNDFEIGDGYTGDTVALLGSTAGDDGWLQLYANTIVSTQISGSSFQDTFFNSGSNVGIGDTSPAALLTVGSGDIFQVSSGGDVTLTGTENPSITLASTDNTVAVLEDSQSGTSEFGTLRLYDNGNERVTLQAPATPTLTLDGSNAQVILQNGSDQFVIIDDGNAGATENGRFRLLSDGNVTKVQLSADSGVDSYINGGNVGIGTTSPGQKLEINGGLRLNTADAKPTCDSTTRGTMWFTQGGAGVKDDFEVCAKDAADAYDWRTIY